MVSLLSPSEIEVLREVRRIAVVELHCDRPLLPEDDLVAALELDSLTRVTLIVAIEDRFRVILPDDELMRVRTLAELCRLVVRQQEAP
jgi:acyl carrier protein